MRHARAAIRDPLIGHAVLCFTRASDVVRSGPAGRGLVLFGPFGQFGHGNRAREVLPSALSPRSRT